MYHATPASVKFKIRVRVRVRVSIRPRIRARVRVWVRVRVRLRLRLRVRIRVTVRVKSRFLEVYGNGRVGFCLNAWLARPRRVTPKFYLIFHIAIGMPPNR